MIPDIWYCDHMACVPGGEYRSCVVPGMITSQFTHLEGSVGCGVVPYLLRPEGAWLVHLEGRQDYPGQV